MLFRRPRIGKSQLTKLFSDKKSLSWLSSLAMERLRKPSIVSSSELTTYLKIFFSHGYLYLNMPKLHFLTSCSLFHIAVFLVYYLVTTNAIVLNQVNSCYRSWTHSLAFSSHRYHLKNTELKEELQMYSIFTRCYLCGRQW